MSDSECATEAAPSEDQAAEEIKKPSRTPAPTATGNERVHILNHNLAPIDRGQDQSHRARPGLELAMWNAGDVTIATATFEVVFYDEEGNTVDTVTHRESTVEPNRSRGVFVPYAPYDVERIKSYAVKVVRTTTADVEKVQLRQNIIRTSETGEEVITGIVKNISTVKTDTAVVATFYDYKEESLGTRVLILRDIEPKTIREYVLRFKPQEGDRVGTYKIEVGELIE